MTNWPDDVIHADYILWNITGVVNYGCSCLHPNPLAIFSNKAVVITHWWTFHNYWNKIKHIVRQIILIKNNKFKYKTPNYQRIFFNILLTNAWKFTNGKQYVNKPYNITTYNNTVIM